MFDGLARLRIGFFIICIIYACAVAIGIEQLIIWIANHISITWSK